jgi:hypothetical protein
MRDIVQMLLRRKRIVLTLGFSLEVIVLQRLLKVCRGLLMIELPFKLLIRILST